MLGSIPRTDTGYRDNILAVLLNSSKQWGSASTRSPNPHSSFVCHPTIQSNTVFSLMRRKQKMRMRLQKRP